LRAWAANSTGGLRFAIQATKRRRNRTFQAPGCDALPVEHRRDAFGAIVMPNEGRVGRRSSTRNPSFFSAQDDPNAGHAMASAENAQRFVLLKQIESPLQPRRQRTTQNNRERMLHQYAAT
jgi:hypothetical protein